MEHLTASTSPIPFFGEDWFDPLEDAIHFGVRAFIETLAEEEDRLSGPVLLRRLQKSGRTRSEAVPWRGCALLGVWRRECCRPCSRCIANDSSCRDESAMREERGRGD
jgi:hypothetical protein